jgi:hypothetical protein
MALKPWYNVVTPREDLREGRPLDASEFAVNLGRITDPNTAVDYRDPKTFFDRTYMTKSLTEIASEVVRRLSGERTETNAVFNMATQFGGGKTHALTLLYHLATSGAKANSWSGVSKILAAARIDTVPAAQTAIFVGTDFDSTSGRGGDDGTPHRRSPWGEIAFQLGGADAFAIVAEHDAELTAPGGDVIRKFLPADEPCLILMDELMNYINRTRKSGAAGQMYTFLQNLSEEMRGRTGAVLAVSIPSSDFLEMSPEDEANYQRLKKLLDRVGKAVAMSSENETSEIIRRRLFEWDASVVDQQGRVLLTKEAIQTCNEYGDWITNHKDQLPKIFDTDNARQAFIDAYPFHPMVLSVFERKWQALPRFQRTRGVLRMLALWVSRAYADGFKGAHKDHLISLGTAPLEDQDFRRAVFEQLGEDKLETAIIADICGGKPDSHAIQLDKEAIDAIKKARLHRKIATTIFFESNGGQAKGETTLPEIRAAVAAPDLDIGNVETALEALSTNAYYLSVEKNKYRFGIAANLNKILSDRRATIQAKDVDERIRSEVTDVFKKGSGVERVYFPEKSGQISDRPELTVIVGDPSSGIQDEKTLATVEQMTRESGTSARTFKSALIWILPDLNSALREDAKKELAWDAIESEATALRLDESQKKQLSENLQKARRDVKESVWRTYKTIVLLDKDNSLRKIDLGLVHSSAADSMIAYILNRLKQDGDVTDSVNSSYLTRHWSPVYKEWSTKSIRDAFFASPQFPRLLSGDAIKETIASGVASGQFAYVAKTESGYDPFIFNESIARDQVEIADDVFIIKKEDAETYKELGLVEPPVPPIVEPGNGGGEIKTGTGTESGEGNGGRLFPNPPTAEVVPVVRWSGEIPYNKISVFYKVLMKLAGCGLKIKVSFETTSPDGVSKQHAEDTRIALRELGLPDDISTE